jgi:hypothetical protein
MELYIMMALPSQCDSLDIGQMLSSEELDSALGWRRLCGLFRHDVMSVSVVAGHGSHRCCLFLQPDSDAKAWTTVLSASCSPLSERLQLGPVSFHCSLHTRHASAKVGREPFMSRRQGCSGPERTVALARIGYRGVFAHVQSSD